MSIQQLAIAQAHTDTAFVSHGLWTFHFTLPQPTEGTTPLAAP